MSSFKMMITIALCQHSELSPPASKRQQTANSSVLTEENLYLKNTKNTETELFAMTMSNLFLR